MTNKHNLNCHFHTPDLASFPCPRPCVIPVLDTGIFYKKKCSRYFIWSILFNLNILRNYFLYGFVGFSVTFIYLVVSVSVSSINVSVISEPEIV